MFGEGRGYFFADVFLAVYDENAPYVWYGIGNGKGACV